MASYRTPNLSETHISQRAKYIQTRMRQADDDVTFEGDLKAEQNKDSEYSLDLKKADEGIFKRTLRFAKRAFTGTQKVESDKEKQEILINGTDAVEFLFFLNQMKLETWKKDEEKKQES